jgi:hypothetical protein
MAYVKPTSTKIADIDETSVLTNLSYLLDGQDYGDLSYTTEMEGGSLRITVSDPDGAERTFELSATEVREGE